MKPEELSKQKYIWVIYRSVTDEIHIEKFPVIYVNKEYVYFKVSSHDLLRCIKVYKVRDSVDGNILGELKYSCQRIYSWSDPMFTKDETTLLLKIIEDERRERRINEMKDYIIKYEMLLKREKENMERLLKEKEKADEVV